ncbi:MAG: methyltransferase domain-containing protein, partial [Phaeodactylibacter sp.]|nr:methyltransferase domain-containing protein [Phaeodactylibacter sp.]
MGTQPFYQPDLAYIHDTFFGQIAESAAREILTRLDPAAQPLVVDLGCGSGILAEQLTNAGCMCIGVDYSKSILQIAR